MHVPANDHDQLLLWLGIDPEEVKQGRPDEDPAILSMTEDILSGTADWL